MFAHLPVLIKVVLLVYCFNSGLSLVSRSLSCERQKAGWPRETEGPHFVFAHRVSEQDLAAHVAAVLVQTIVSIARAVAIHYRLSLVLSVLTIVAHTISV